MTAESVTIGRLSLHAGALSDAEARRLAELVGLALGQLPMRPTESVSVSVPAQPGSSVDQIANAVVHAIESTLRVEQVR